VDGVPWPLKPPSFSDLGIRGVERGVVGDEGVGAEEWPLHVKNVSLIDYEKILETSKGTRFFPLLSHCFSFLNDDVFYERKNYTKKDVPNSVFSSKQVDTLLQYNKISIFEKDSFFGFVKGFLVKEEAKKRQRPIFEPSLNSSPFSSSFLIPLKYPSRFALRCNVNEKMYRIDFDFSAFFDSFVSTKCQWGQDLAEAWLRLLQIF
jgi:hypothetical protein